MIHLALVTGIGLLLFRVIWIIFSFLESLFQKSSPVINSNDKDKTNLNKSSTQKNSYKNNVVPQTTKILKNEVSQKINSKPLSTSKVEPKQSKLTEPKKQEEVKEKPLEREKREVRNQIIQKVEEMIEKPFIVEKKEQSKSQVEKENLLSKNEKKAYEEKIAELKSEVEQHRLEKVKYIQKIQEIIDHIINEQEQRDQKLSTDQEECPISSLKNELNAASLKMKEQQNQLRELFEQEKRYISNSYQQKLQECKALHADQISEYMTTIDEISQRLYQLEEEKSNKLHENKEIVVNDNESFVKELKEEKDKAVALCKQIQEELAEMRRVEAQTRSEYELLKEQLITSQNDAIESKTKLEAQINSLIEQQTTLQQQLTQERQNRFNFQQQLEEQVFKHQHDKIEAEESSKTSQLVQKLENDLNKQKYLREEEERKTSETIEQLKFCQEQLKTARQTEAELRAKLVQALDSPKKTFVRKEDVEKHPEFIALKRKLEQLEGRKTTAPENKSSIMHTYTSPRQNRQMSPTFPVSGGQEYKRTISPNFQARGIYKSGFAGVGNEEKPVNLVPPMSSTIMADRRYKTPSQKPMPTSSYLRTNQTGTYLGETNILSEAQRNLIVHEVSALKKITIRKTSLLYTSANKPNKPVTEYLVGVPNLLVIVELANKNIIGAFTQNAFTKANQFSHSTIMSKAMIFSILPQTFIVNEHRGEAIHFEENVLTWGKQEITINCNEPMTMNANLNCEEAVYNSAISTEEFMGGETKNVSIVKIEAYRNFFG